MKVLHTADWHIGLPKSPYKDGVNLRLRDTINCLNRLRTVAAEERPDYILVSGDIFDTAEVRQARGHKEVLMAREAIMGLSRSSFQVIVMRGTPNHDSAEAFEELEAHFSLVHNVRIVTTPQVVSFGDADIAVLPGFDKGKFRAEHPGLSQEEENAAFTEEISNIVLGLRAQCAPDSLSILMAHYTVPGCNTESGQVMMMGQSEPMLPQEALQTAGYDLVALGHIHRPQAVPGLSNCYYSGAINQMNFNDEGQERGFWIHESDDAGRWRSTFHKTPYREFFTLRFAEEDVAAINLGNLEEVACSHWRYNGTVQDKIVRILYRCSEENAKAYRMKRASIEKALLEDGAFMLWENLPEADNGQVNRTEFTGTTDPEKNLIRYLEEKQVSPNRIQELVLRARPIIADAGADMSAVANTGIFEPVEISVENYRNYEREKFDFRDITFCTVNGQNGAGKSSLLMDAVVDCLYEDPREGELSGWVRNDVNGCKGAIIFIFHIGEKTYRVTRTRTRPKKDAKNKTGKGTLNLSELVDGEWEDRSSERAADTQKEIMRIIGMDSLTFKSCALIMQDQYGLFLQAKPEERGEVLSTLLGLGIYQEMERIAQDRSRAARAKAGDLKQRIGIHANTISSFGKPDEELSECQKTLAIHEDSLRIKTEERDKNKLILLDQQVAAERHKKLQIEIATLEEKKAVAERNRAGQQAIIDNSEVILSDKAEVEAKVEEHKTLLKKEASFARGSAVYSAKKKELQEFSEQIRQEGASLGALKEEVSQKKSEILLLQPTDYDTVVRKNAAEYERYSKLLQEARELQVRYTEAVAERDRRAYAVDSKRAYINQEIGRLKAKKADLERRAGLLEDSGCPDIDHAECRFLADALDAKKHLPEAGAELSGFEQSQAIVLQKLVQEAEEAEKAIGAVGYDAERMAEYRLKVTELSSAPEELKKLEARDSQIALIKARLEHTQSNILETEKRLAALRSKASETEQECSRYAESFEEHASIQRSIEALEPWLEKERQLPVMEERRAAAMRREQELAAEIEGIGRDIVSKRAEADKGSLALKGIDERKADVERLDKDISAINARIREKQTKIGALQQTMEQVTKLEQEIKILQKTQTGHALEMADYDILKAAFSQDGVPHQIIRSVIPQLTTVANTILGQMTGGKMGVEFRLERMQNKKEKASLDIFIEEYGRSVLPYLSKSGGEKVKASLSVILALAEIKSSAAGVQLGFLQIDEPPFLDSDGTQAYVDALETIHQRYAGLKVIAITHDQEFKARFPQSVTVYKDEHGSHVVQD